MGLNRVHIDGTLGGGIERWSTSFAVANAAGGFISDPADLQTWANACRDAWAVTTGWSANLKALLSSAGTIQKVRIYAYDAPGGEALSTGESTGAAVPGAGSVTLPFQSSLVFTLRTAFPGRSRRGRMYWPVLTGTLNSGGIYGSSTSQQTLCDSMAEALEFMASIAPGSTGQYPAVASAAANLVTPVTAVRLGNVIDTQRRRRDAIPETFSTSPVL